MPSKGDCLWKGILCINLHENKTERRNSETIDVQLLFDDKSQGLVKESFNWLENGVEEVDARVYDHTALFKFRDPINDIPVKHFFAAAQIVRLSCCDQNKRLSNKCCGCPTKLRLLEILPPKEKILVINTAPHLTPLVIAPQKNYPHAMAGFCVDYPSVVKKDKERNSKEYVFNEQCKELPQQKVYDLYWSIVQKFLESLKSKSNNSLGSPVTPTEHSRARAAGPLSSPVSSPADQSSPCKGLDTSTNHSRVQKSLSDTQDGVSQLQERIVQPKSSSGVIPKEKSVLSSEDPSSSNQQLQTDEHPAEVDDDRNHDTDLRSAESTRTPIDQTDKPEDSDKPVSDAPNNSHLDNPPPSVMIVDPEPPDLDDPPPSVQIVETVNLDSSSQQELSTSEKYLANSSKEPSNVPDAPSNIEETSDNERFPQSDIGETTAGEDMRTTVAGASGGNIDMQPPSVQMLESSQETVDPYSQMPPTPAVSPPPCDYTVHLIPDSPAPPRHDSDTDHSNVVGNQASIPSSSETGPVSQMQNIVSRLHNQQQGPQPAAGYHRPGSLGNQLRCVPPNTQYTVPANSMAPVFRQPMMPPPQQPPAYRPPPHPAGSIPYSQVYVHGHGQSQATQRTIPHSQVYVHGSIPQAQTQMNAINHNQQMYARSQVLNDSNNRIRFGIRPTGYQPQQYHPQMQAQAQMMAQQQRMQYPQPRLHQPPMQQPQSFAQQQHRLPMQQQQRMPVQQRPMMSGPEVLQVYQQQRMAVQQTQLFPQQCLPPVQQQQQQIPAQQHSPGLHQNQIQQTSPGQQQQLTQHNGVAQVQQSPPPYQMHISQEDATSLKVAANIDWFKQTFDEHPALRHFIKDFLRNPELENLDKFLLECFKSGCRNRNFYKEAFEATLPHIVSAFSSFQSQKPSPLLMEQIIDMETAIDMNLARDAIRILQSTITPGYPAVLNAIKMLLTGQVSILNFRENFGVEDFDGLKNSLYHLKRALVEKMIHLKDLHGEHFKDQEVIVELNNNLEFNSDLAKIFEKRLLLYVSLPEKFEAMDMFFKANIKEEEFYEMLGMSLEKVNQMKSSLPHFLKACLEGSKVSQIKNRIASAFKLDALTILLNKKESLATTDEKKMFIAYLQKTKMNEILPSVLLNHYFPDDTQYYMKVTSFLQAHHNQALPEELVRVDEPTMSTATASKDPKTILVNIKNSLPTDKEKKKFLADIQSLATKDHRNRNWFLKYFPGQEIIGKGLIDFLMSHKLFNLPEELRLEGGLNAEVPVLHIAEPSAASPTSVTTSQSARDDDLRTPSPVAMDTPRDIANGATDKVLSMPIIVQQSPKNPSLPKKYSDNGVFKYLEKTLQSKNLTVINTAKNQLIQLLNGESTIEEFVGVLDPKSRKEIFFNKVIELFETELPEFSEMVCSNILSLSKLHWTFSDVKVMNGKVTIHKTVTSDQTDKQREVTSNQDEIEPNQQQEESHQQRTFILDFQLLSEWVVEVRDKKRKCKAVFTSHHIIFFPAAFTVPANIPVGHNFPFKMFPDKISGKVYVPDPSNPSKDKESFFRLVTSDEDFVKHFLNTANLSESTTLFERSMFEGLSINFTSLNNMQYKVTPTIISPDTEINNPSNTCIKLLSNIFGTMEKVVNYKGVLEGRHQIPQSQVHQFGFQLHTFGVRLQDYILIFPQSPTVQTNEVYEYFNSYIYYGENISTAECKVANTKILKLVFPSKREHQAEQLKSRDAAIHHLEIVSVLSTNQDTSLLDYVKKNTGFAIRADDWPSVSSNSQVHAITQTKVVDKIWFEVDLAVKIIVTSGITLCVTYLKTQDSQELIDTEFEFGEFKYLVQIYADEESFPGSLYNFKEGVYIQRVGDVNKTNLTTNPPRPVFKELKLRFIKNAQALSYALTSRESCLCNEESFVSVLKKMRSWECCYGSRSLESVHPGVQLKASDVRLPKMKIVSASQPACPSPLSRNVSAKSTPVSSPARSSLTASPSRVVEKVATTPVCASPGSQHDEPKQKSKKCFLREERVEEIDIVKASEAELYEIPGIDKHTARKIGKYRKDLPTLDQFVSKHESNHLYLKRIQFDVGKLARNKMRLFYGSSALTKTVVENLKFVKKKHKKKERETGPPQPVTFTSKETLAFGKSKSTPSATKAAKLMPSLGQEAVTDLHDFIHNFNKETDSFGDENSSMAANSPVVSPPSTNVSPTPALKDKEQLPNDDQMEVDVNVNEEVNKDPVNGVHETVINQKVNEQGVANSSPSEQHNIALVPVSDVSVTDDEDDEEEDNSRYHQLKQVQSNSFDDYEDVSSTGSDIEQAGLCPFDDISSEEELSPSNGASLFEKISSGENSMDACTIQNLNSDEKDVPVVEGDGEGPAEKEPLEKSRMMENPTVAEQAIHFEPSCNISLIQQASFSPSTDRSVDNIQECVSRQLTNLETSSEQDKRVVTPVKLKNLLKKRKRSSSDEKSRDGQIMKPRKKLSKKKHRKIEKDLPRLEKRQSRMEDFYKSKAKMSLQSVAKPSQLTFFQPKLFSPSMVKIERLSEEIIASYQQNEVDDDVFVALQETITLQEGLEADANDARLLKLRVTNPQPVDHILKHKVIEKEKKFSCSICKVLLNSFAEQQEHYEGFPTKCCSQQIYVKCFTCNVCKEEFPSHFERHRHIMAAHVDSSDNAAEGLVQTVHDHAEPQSVEGDDSCGQDSASLKAETPVEKKDIDKDKDEAGDEISCIELDCPMKFKTKSKMWLHYMIHVQ